MIALLFMLFLAQSCQESFDPNFPYRLDYPEKTFQLHSDLGEISGLSPGLNDQTLAAIEDETGRIFIMEKKTGAIQLEIPFWKEGDYEGIEVVGEDIFVVKSNSNLYQVQFPGTEAQNVVRHSLPLDKSCDVEGLAYDAAQNRLLLACKGDSGIENARAFFTFSLETMSLDTTPAYVVYWDSIVSYLRANPTADRMEKLQEVFDPQHPELAFSPSGLAIHPITGQFYILSSVGKLLLVLDPLTGAIAHIQKLKKKIHPQPEGICFDRDGSLYISNEGRGEQALLHRFNYRPSK